MRRREFLALGAAAFAAPPARAQKGPRRIAWLSPVREADGQLFLDALRRGLGERGYAEGRNLALERHWGDESNDRLAQIVAKLVADAPEVIVAQGPPAVNLRRATTAIPVVFGYSGDPVEAGLIDSLARPGRNMTGISFLALDLVGKRMQLLKEVLPGTKRVAVLANPQHAGDKAERRVSEHAAAALGLQIDYYEARSVDQIAPGLAAIEKTGCDAALMFPVQGVMNRRRQIAEWSVRTRIPTISGWAQFAEGGNLLSYGPDLAECYGRLANFVDRILKGVRPSELPAELPSRVLLAVNLRAARSLGVKVPHSVLLRADRVIE